MVKRFFAFFRPYWRQQLLVVVLGTAEYALLNLAAFGLKFLLDSAQAGDYVAFGRLYGLIFAGAVCGILIGSYSGYRWKCLQQTAIAAMRSRTFMGILKKDTAFFARTPVGAVTSKVLDDVYVAAQVGATAMPTLIINLFRIVLVLALMFSLDVRLTLLTVAAIPVYYLSFNLVNGKIRTLGKLEREKNAAIYATTGEYISAVDTITVYGKQRYFSKKLGERIGEYFEAARRQGRYVSVGGGISSAFQTLLPIGLVAVGAYLSMGGHMAMSALIAFNLLLPFLTEPISNISDLYLGFQSVMGNLEGIMDNLQTEDETPVSVKDSRDPIDSLTLDEVTCGYEGHAVIKGLSARFERGDCVAILGPSGAGKTTLIRLLLKVIAPMSGSVRAGVVGLEALDTAEYYRSVAYMSQFPFVFQDTICQNLTLGEACSEAQIAEAVAMAGLDTVIVQQPGGLDHELLEAGRNLSGGQKQRICLARTLLRGSDILILDEPTSSLDSQSHQGIVEALKVYSAARRPMMFIISHKPDILDICNKAVVFSGDGVRPYQMDSPEARARVQAIAAVIAAVPDKTR